MFNALFLTCPVAIFHTCTGSSTNPAASSQLAAIGRERYASDRTRVALERLLDFSVSTKFQVRINLPGSDDRQILQIQSDYIRTCLLVLIIQLDVRRSLHGNAPTFRDTAIISADRVPDGRCCTM
jgi:hypothetical protein